MKKEILLLSSLVSLSIVFFIGFPNDKNVEDKKALIQKQFELNNPPSSEIFGVEMLLAFDLVRLEPTGDVIMAGKTKPQIKIDIFDGNQKLSSVTSDVHGDWVWMSDKKIEDGLKRFHLKHQDSNGNIFHSSENVIIFFEKDKIENQKVVKIINKKNAGIEILNNKLIKGLALDIVEHHANGRLRVKGRSLPDSEIKFLLSEKLVGKTNSDANGNWEFNLGQIKFNNYDLQIESIYKNNVISLKTEILNGNINDKLFYEKKFIVEEGNSLWRIARKTLGGGILYAEIYKNNKKIIKDPDLIFPGQVFNIPNLKHSSLNE